MRASSSPSSISPDLAPLARGDLPATTVALARFLIGCTLVRIADGVRLAGRIVETEAYLVGDAASHAFRGPTRRNPSMFRERGHAYVYISYGCWPMLNVSGAGAGIGEAVLLRALEPIDGIDAMQAAAPATRLRDVTRGPGRLARALRVTLADDGTDLCAPGPLHLAAPVRRRGPITVTTRIGISKDMERPLRFIERGSGFVSGSVRLNRGVERD